MSQNPVTANFGIFIPPNLAHGNSPWAASIVSVCDNYGTYVMQCTAGTAPSHVTCGPSAPVGSMQQQCK